jgi:phage-related protein
MPITRPAIFHLRARDEIRALPKPVRISLGRALSALQHGYPLGMPVSRPMPAVAPGVAELRLHGSDGQYRVFYHARTTVGILVLRAFQKKSARTPLTEIDIVRRRLKEMMHAWEEVDRS